MQIDRDSHFSETLDDVAGLTKELVTIDMRRDWIE
jgi:hypothetical protein